MNKVLYAVAFLLAGWMLHQSYLVTRLKAGAEMGLGVAILAIAAAAALLFDKPVLAIGVYVLAITLALIFPVYPDLTLFAILMGILTTVIAGQCWVHRRRA